MEANLEYAADSKAEAYRIGAEEAQAEIVHRLHMLLPKSVTDAKPEKVAATDHRMADKAAREGGE